MKVFLGGREKLSCRFRKMMPGAVGLGAMKANAIFDNFRVQSPLILP